MGGGTKELSGPDLSRGISAALLEPNKPLLGHADGEAVVVVRVGDAVHAIGASCTHYGGPLAEGLVVDGTIRCPWHHACFSLRSGRAVGAPALADVPCFDVVLHGGRVQVGKKKESGEKATVAGPRSVVVVGAGAAAAACVEMLRKEGYPGPIAMLGAEDPGPVDRPNLSKDYLAGTAPEEWIPLGSREHWTELGVELAPTDPATAIDTKAKTVTTKSGRTIPYGALLYATGAEPSRLSIPGAERALLLRSLSDSRAIIQRAAGAKKAVVVGASFIGLEVAASLVARGLEVHVVAPDPVPLARVLGDEVGAFVRKVHEEKGVRFHLGRKPRAIHADRVELDDGASIAADLVVFGVGVKPRTELAVRAGLDVDDGVIVDDRLRTSADGVFAAGDVARFVDGRTGERMRIEHWVVAERQGQAAARAMLGKGAPFRDVPFFWSAHYDVVLAYVGHASTFDEVKVRGSLAGRDATVAYFHRGKVRAVVTVNRDQVSLAAEAAMERGDDAALARLVAE